MNNFFSEKFLPTAAYRGDFRLKRFSTEKYRFAGTTKMETAVKEEGSAKLLARKFWLPLDFARFGQLTSYR